MNDRVAFQDSEPPADENNPPPEVNAADQAWEDRARRMGWRPQAEWRGDPTKWRSAREFVEHAENNTPVLIERMHKLERVNSQQAEKLDEANKKLTETTQVLAELYKWAQRADARAYERAVTEVENRKRAAVADANTAEYDKAQQELAALEKGRDQVLPPEPPKPPAAPPAAPQQPVVSPVIQKWTEDNHWWFNDPVDREPNQMAISIFGTLKIQQPEATEQQLLDQVMVRIKKMYPEKFMNQRRSAPSAVSEPSAPAGHRPTNKEFSYEDLPADAKQQCDRFVKIIPGYTRESYVKEYVRQSGDNK